MSQSVSYEVTVVLPTVEEFAEHFPHYGPRARGDGRPFFDLVMRPETFITAAALTRCLRIPAVSAIAAEAVEIAGGEIAGADKQFLGALMCVLMEHNDFAKTGRKGSVPHPAWNRGEIYTRE